MTGGGPAKARAQGVCVIGRTDFHTGMGAVTASACESLARSFPVSLLPTRDFRDAAGDAVVLPSGRSIPVTKDAQGFAAYFFTDVLWNGSFDRNYQLVPADGFRVAHIPYDSDELPDEWVEILNERFDAVLFSSGHLEAVAATSGVNIPTGTLPIALDLESLIGRKYRAPVAGRIRIGSLSAFHERKNLDVLVEAFLKVYGHDDGVELVLHSNLAMGDVFDRVQAMCDMAPRKNVVISRGNLSGAAKNALLDTFDGYVNCSSGEGYSIGPREALALGKPAALSDIGAHQDLLGTAGVFPIATGGRMPARYMEIDHRVFGGQAIVTPAAVADALVSLVEFVRSSRCAPTVIERRRVASQFTFTSLVRAYEQVLDPDSVAVRRRAPANPTADTVSVGAAARELLGRHGSAARGRDSKLVVPLHDGGFFSIFNTFMTHLVWGLRDERVGLVLPDWDVTQLLKTIEGDNPTSYCYSNVDDGNLWLRMFEPLYGLSPELMNDREFLAEGAFAPADQFNVAREPLLTYKNAFELYRRPWFQNFRNEYNGALSDHVRLRPELRGELDGLLSDSFGGRFVVAAHVKHPSHMIEQPDGLMASNAEYVAKIYGVLRDRGISPSSDDWRLFVATDQERVARSFRDEFGANAVVFDDVDRVDAETDNAYDLLDLAAQSREVHQLQHQRATDRSAWSWRLAWEVWRDAEAMAASDVLLHVVSNVSTAVSYLGTQVEMTYVAPRDARGART